MGQGAFLVDVGHQQMTSIVLNSDGSGLLYCLCMGKYSRCMGCLLTFGTAVVGGLWIAVVCCLAFIISTRALEVFVNIREMWQEVNNFFSCQMRTESCLWGLVSDIHLKLNLPWHSWGRLGVRDCNLVRPSWAQFSLSHLLLPSSHSWDANYCPAQEVRLSLLSWLILIF